MKYFIFRNFTIEPLFTNFEVNFSGYDDISFIDPDADIFIWFYNMGVNPDTDQQIKEIDHYFGKIDYLIKQIPASKDFYIFTLVDVFSFKWKNSNFDLDNKISEFNRKIQSLSFQNQNIKIIDFKDFTKDNAAVGLLNWKYYYTSYTLINPALSKQFQIWFTRKIKAILSVRRKCIVLDLDNTLWGGIVGEDGIEGIQLGNTYPGNCYIQFQRYLLEASKNGIILAICSKNNEDDVLEAFEKNPNMVLSMDHIVAYKINWNNKPANIEALADELNIGIDSMVFIDDSPVEREIVRNAFPEIYVPEFPDQPYRIVPFFLDILNDNFQIHQLTREDIKKTSLYKENYQRTRYKSDFTTIKDYLKNLEIELVISEANRYNIPRIAQMTQKTNQFNLTTKRYTETDIHKFTRRGDMVLCAAVKDKFGDNGITVLAIATLNKKSSNAVIDSYLLSCRILGRGIENVFLRILLNRIYERGFNNVEASYIPTKKNEQVKDFYEKNGFKVTGGGTDEKRYEIILEEKFKIEPYYKISTVQS